jgi:putative hydrolase of the HAD superfamily
MRSALSHIDTWIFDLDNTLYPASCDLFALIDERMTAYIERLLSLPFAEARRRQKAYFVDYGTTLAGLIADHAIDPRHFLDDVHDIDMARLKPDLALNAVLANLPGRKLVFTNGNDSYAERVLDALGMAGIFEAVHDIHANAYIPKPDPRCYDVLCEQLNVTPKSALFAEDMARNLRPAKALGMATLWINNGSEHGNTDACASYIDYETHDLSHWLVSQFEQEIA